MVRRRRARRVLSAGQQRSRWRTFIDAADLETTYDTASLPLPEAGGRVEVRYLVLLEGDFVTGDLLVSPGEPLSDIAAFEPGQAYAPPNDPAAGSEIQARFYSYALAARCRREPHRREALGVAGQLPKIDGLPDQAPREGNGDDG